MQEAIVEAACQRLRAVLLTSLTTIAGLLPLLFETSLQAQFLIPMAVSISFGLAFATFLVLLLVPSLLAGLEGAYACVFQARSRARRFDRSRSTGLASCGRGAVLREPWALRAIQAAVQPRCRP